MGARAKIIVTGGAGYIGSHTIIELLQRMDQEIVSIDNFSNSDPVAYERIRAITGTRVRDHAIDLCDRTAVGQLFNSGIKPAAIIHFAAFKAMHKGVLHSTA